MLTLRRRILFTIIGVFILLILLLYIAAERTAFITLQNLEDQISRQNVMRVAQAIKNELNSLVQTSMDYARWDDTYQFIAEASHGNIDKEYVATNFSDSNMQSNRLNLLVYVNPDEKVIVQKAFDLETHHEMPVPARFLDKSVKNLLQSVDSTTPKAGIIDSDYGLMLIASHPILPNSGATPNRGSLIFGRLLNAAEIQEFTNITLLPATIYSLNDLTALPEDVQRNGTSLRTMNSVVLHPVSNNQIIGYTPLADVDGNPIALLQVDMPRSIQQQGHISLNYLVTVLIILVLIFGIIVSYILEKWVLTPVSDLGRHVNHIGASADLSTRLKVQGSDEISQLTQDINQMLDALETAQQDQRRSEARYRAIFEQASEGIVFADASTHQLLAANPAFLQLTGYNAYELPTLTAYDIVMTDKTIYGASIDKISTVQRYAITEHVYRRKDGTRLEVESSAVLLPPDNGYMLYCMVVRDITERVKSEARLRQTQKLESIGLLAGGIAHDFNNLLTGMLGQTSLALDKLSPDHPARSNVNKAVISVRRAADLTRQLLAYAGRGQFLIEPVDLNQLIGDNTSLLETALMSHVQLQLLLEPNLALINADRGQIQQIVMNLVINAAEAIDNEYGNVTVTTSSVNLTANDEQQYVGGDKLPLGDYICLEVSDTGIGMDDETLNRIFDPFSTTKEFGTGLGLSATQGIVRTHNGGLQVTSCMGKGTTFRIFFPAATHTLVEQDSPVVINAKSAGCVLVIDDEKSVREVVRDILEMNGLHVIVAENGQMGIELFKENHTQIQVILLDMQMPVMNGEETFHSLRAFDPDVKVILSSGHDETEATHRFVGQGLAAFLQKPYDLDTLLAKIHHVLGHLYNLNHH
ncbi:hypothetical protein BH10CHL1_BH10CHL1_34120 [soil metagenome]